jgi:hypothetical protein
VHALLRKGERVSAGCHRKLRLVCLLGAILALPAAQLAQETSAVRVAIVLPDASGVPTPVARHALLVSENPATGAPRRVLTGADGTVVIKLPPGSYIIESESPVAALGKGYQWTQVVEIAAGRDTTLVLTIQNAELVPPPAPVPPRSPAPDDADSGHSALLAKWQDSVVAVWSPTTRASGFLIDERGLIATDANAIGAATSVHVQVSPALKVPARVLVADRRRGVAILWIDPSVVGGRAPLALPCAPGSAPSLDDGDLIVALAMHHGWPTEAADGQVTALHPGAIETTLRLGFGGVGGPVSNEAGALVGLTSSEAYGDGRHLIPATVVRAVTICEVLAAATSHTVNAAPPAPTPLPVEPAREYPAEALLASAGSDPERAAPRVISSSDFDVAFITPPLVARTQPKRGWTRSATGGDARALLGGLTEFGGWSRYFTDRPPVLAVRVTPKLVEAWWKRLAREAARTQGASLPPLKAFAASFGRMRVSCGAAEVTPIQPLVIEHQLSDKATIREGLYVFDPDALGPHCGTVTLSIYPENASARADALTVPTPVLRQAWDDFAPYRASAK